jgi:hypothetical protein
MLLDVTISAFFAGLIFAAIYEAIYDIKTAKQNKECNHFYHIDGDERTRCLHCGEESNGGSKDHDADKR